MNAASPDLPADLPAAPPRVGYARSAGSRRGEARRAELLDRVTADLAANGLVDFSLRRAARAAGTTHKVLLYYFDSADDLLGQAVDRLRDKRTAAGLVAGAGGPPRSLADRVRAIWPVLAAEEQRVLDQAIGLSLYDPGRYGQLGRESSREYLPVLMSICPQAWPERRRHDVAELILAAFRGFLIELRISGDEAGVQQGLEAFLRALEREEAAAG
ncbi:MAG TPA: TetR/AcrR family transcriptional regulator [Streptosporangiaceae bacterium]|nr:TetR/AcrR family transcriptional regulator [Streptosporangiaceae bacterium]